MNDWRKLVEQRRFAEAEPIVKAELKSMKTGDEMEDSAWYHEQWGDFVEDKAEKKRLYSMALHNYQIFASWATSGGEGTARMLSVNRLSGKIKTIEEK